MEVCIVLERVTHALDLLTQYLFINNSDVGPLWANISGFGCSFNYYHPPVKLINNVQRVDVPGQHTCMWVFITADLSDGLDYWSPLFFVMSFHLISPHSQVRGDRWKPPVCLCAHSCICLGLSSSLDIAPRRYSRVHVHRLVHFVATPYQYSTCA